MVYLEVYNSIFKYLEEIEIVDDVFEYAKELMNPLFDKIKSNELLNDMVAEFAIFNYMHDGQLLIDFLSKNLCHNLNENEKKEFDLIQKSKRSNLIFNKKEKLNKLDAKGKELYNFYFEDIDHNKTKAIVSSTAIDELKGILNARLIENPLHKGKFSIIGGIFDKKTFEVISSLSALRLTEKKLEKMESHVGHILEFSKEHNLEEIGNYKNEKSNFLEQDKQIMRINRLFFEKFNMGFDDFLKNFLELPNNSEKFIEMVEYYLSIADELKETILDTNYIFPFSLLLEKSLIKGFAGFIKKDKITMKQCMVELKERGEAEFKDNLKNEISLSREGIIKNNKKFLKKEVALLNPDGFNSFIKKLDNYSPAQIREFLSDIVDYTENLYEDTDEIGISFFTAMSKSLYEKAEEIPYLNDVVEKQKNYKYTPEEFYNYIDADDEVYNLFLFLSVAAHIINEEIKEAYLLLKEHEIAKTKSFDMMFLSGKILSFLMIRSIKNIFNEAKKIDKEKYKKELKKFIIEKNQRLLIL